MTDSIIILQPTSRAQKFTRECRTTIEQWECIAYKYGKIIQDMLSCRTIVGIQIIAVLDEGHRLKSHELEMKIYSVGRVICMLKNKVKEIITETKYAFEGKR